MKLSEFKNNKQIVVCYPGRFQPFHCGHSKVYRWLKTKFNTVFVVTSDKVDPPRSPFNFLEKQAMMKFAGVDENDIVQVKSPYRASEVYENYNDSNTILVYAVSEKDMETDPRFDFSPNKDGSSSYFQPYSKNMEPFAKHAYILTVPVFEFELLGEPLTSSTQIRDQFVQADHRTQAKMIHDLYNKYNKKLHNIFIKRLVPKLEEDLTMSLISNWERFKKKSPAKETPDSYDAKSLLRWFESILSEWKASGRLTKRLANLVNPYWPSDYLYARALKAGAPEEEVEDAWTKFKSLHPDLWKKSEQDQKAFNIDRTPTSLRHPDDLFETPDVSILKRQLLDSYKGISNAS